MAFSDTIASYTLYYFGKKSRDTSSIAQILLYDTQNRIIGHVYFYRDGQVIPNNSANERVDPKQVHLKMHESQLDTVVDMLRNEKPCRVHYRTPTFAYLYTGPEPVGEEESEE